MSWRCPDYLPFTSYFNKSIAYPDTHIDFKLDINNFNGEYFFDNEYDVSTRSAKIQPRFIIDKDDGILILTGWEQWNPLHPVTRIS